MSKELVKQNGEEKKIKEDVRSAVEVVVTVGTVVLDRYGNEKSETSKQRIYH